MAYLLDVSTIAKPLHDADVSVGAVFVRYAPRFTMCVPCSLLPLSRGRVR